VVAERNVSGYDAETTSGINSSSHARSPMATI
jgi:hypothetical protein